MPSDFPVLFTIGESSKNDVVLINPGLSIEEISTKIESLIASSPNCEDRLAKYSKNQSAYKVKGLKVRWSGEPREGRLWPKATILSEHNAEAVLSLVALHGGKDILEVDAQQDEAEGKENQAKEGESKEGESTELPERKKEE